MVEAYTTDPDLHRDAVHSAVRKPYMPAAYREATWSPRRAGGKHNYKRTVQPNGWTLEELARLVIGWKVRMHPRDVALFVGRSVHACHHKRSLLRMTNRGERGMVAGTWSTDETDLLKVAHKALPYSQIARILNRNKNEVAGKIFRLRKMGEL